ncbi:MAG: NfeD family protein [bacterium]
MRSFLLLLFVVSLMASGLSASDIFVVRLDGVIGPVIAKFIAGAIKQAEEENAACLIIEIDTPGGLDTAMREIVQTILSSRVPVAVYVSPQGARCASAGVFIAMSADVIGMAPGTSIGAAHPVTIGGSGVDDAMVEKMVNDSASYLKSLAAMRGRNQEWAELAVRESATATPDEARQKGIIDVLAGDLDEFIKAIDGKGVDDAKGGMIRTAESTIRMVRMGLRYRLLSRLSDPNVAYILLILGFYGLFFELSNPGSIFPGVVGAVFILLALFSFQMLPINYTGVLLILLGIAFLTAEIWVTSGGLLSIGGAIALFLGSLMLVESPGPFLKISYKVIVPAVLLTVGFFVFVVGAGLRAQWRKVVTGTQGLVGERGFATTDIDPIGQVFVHGELWNARSDERISKDESVEVVSVDGLVVEVRRIGLKKEIEEG